MAAAAFDEVRAAVARVDALAHSVELLFDDTHWSGTVDHQRLERVASLIGACAEAAAAALVAVDRHNADMLSTAIPVGAEPGEWP